MNFDQSEGRVSTPLNSKRRIAMAIHPHRMYENEQSREFIQRMFDNPNFDTTVAVKLLEDHDNRNPDWQLFVRSKQVISSGLTRDEDSILNKMKYRIVKDEDFVRLFEDKNEVQITLMGGETPISDTERGCHREAFLELIKWFFDSKNDTHHTLKIYIPFKGLFIAGTEAVDYKNQEWIELFRKKYHSDMAQRITIGRSGAVFIFQK